MFSWSEELYDVLRNRGILGEDGPDGSGVGDPGGSGFGCTSGHADLGWSNVPVNSAFGQVHCIHEYA